MPCLRGHGHPTWGAPNCDAAASALVKRAENGKLGPRSIFVSFITEAARKATYLATIIKRRRSSLEFRSQRRRHFAQIPISSIHPSPICGSHPSAKPPLSLLSLSSDQILHLHLVRPTAARLACLSVLLLCHSGRPLWGCVQSKLGVGIRGWLTTGGEMVCKT